MSIQRWTVADPARMSVVPAQDGDLVTHADHLAAVRKVTDFFAEETADYVKPYYVDSSDEMVVSHSEHVVAVEAAHAAGMREALADFLTSIDEDDPVYLRGHAAGLRDGIEIGRTVAAHDVEQLGVWAVNPDSFIRLTDGTRLVRLNDAVKAARGEEPTQFLRVIL